MTLSPSRPTEAPAVVLVERDRPLAELAGLLAEARAGAGRFVIVRGEAGIGKSALVDRFVGDIGPGPSVVTGLCDGVTTPKPFGPLYDMAATLGPALHRLLDERAPRHAVSAWVTDRVASIGPTVMVVEDVHWADEATAELLTYLARRIGSIPLLVVATLRDDDEQRPPIRRFTGQLAGMAAVRQLVLERLSADGVREMAAGGDADATELHRLTGGNPFFVTQVLAFGGAEPVPISISDALEARLARLSPRGRSALQAAAVIGSHVEPWLLAAVAGEDVLGADECIAAGLLAKSETVDFRHELTRIAVLSNMPVFRGIALHRRALDALLQIGSTDDSRLAYHADGAADAARVLRHAVAAAEAAMRVGANHEAVAQLERARRFIDHAEDAERARVLELLALALYSVNRIPEAYPLRREALGVRRRMDDTVGVAMNEWHLGRLAAWQAMAAEGRKRIHRAREILEPLGESRELALVWISEGANFVGEDNETARSWIERALVVGRRLNDGEVISVALNLLGTMGILEGDGDGEQLLSEAAQVARVHGLYERTHSALFNLGISLMDAGEPLRAEGVFAELLDYVSGVQIERCNLDASLARIRLASGRWAESEHLARVSLAYARTPSDDQALALTTLATLDLRRGGGEWASLLDRAEAIVEGYDDPGLIAPIVALRAEAAWLHGSLPDLVPRLRGSLAWATAAPNRWAIGELGLWLILAGDRDRLPDGAAEPYRLAATGERRRAAEAFEGRGMPYTAAMALAISDEAEELRDAHDRFQALGAEAVARKVAHRLRDLGASVPRGPRPQTRRNPGGLTDRELEVAQLLADGLSNRQIAEALFVTEKTVGHHVSAVLARLGVERRGQVAGRLAAEG